MISSRLSYLKPKNILRIATHTRCLSLLPSYFGDFQNYLPKIVDKYLDNNKYTDSMEIKQHVKKLCEYHTLAREPIHGKLALSAFNWLAKADDLTEHNIHQIKVLAWVIELLQSYFIIGDDVEDQSETRFGKLCWHLLPGVSFLAIHDSSLLRSVINEILRDNIDDTLVPKMANYINEAYLSLDISQYLDITISQSKDFNKFTMEYYEKCANFEYMYYTIKLPIFVALAMCNKDTKESHQLIDEVFIDLAILSKMENDLMDYMGYISLTGKTSSDIQKRKCSWPALVALQHGNDSQRRVFESCYGRYEPENVKRIVDLYEELDLLNLYRHEEAKRYQAVKKKIDDLPKDSTPSPQFCRQIVKFIQDNVTSIATSSSQIKADLK